MKREELTIGNTTFFVQKFAATKQSEIFGDLQKMLVPAFGQLLGGFSQNDAMDKSDQAFVQGLKSLSAQLDGKSLLALAYQLILPEYVAFVRDDFNNGNDTKLTKDKFDSAFEDMSELIELMIFILKLNYASFFTKFLSRLGTAQG